MALGRRSAAEGTRIRRLKPLTDKEREVLGCITAGHTLSDVGRLLGVSRNTVHFHVKNIYRKLDVSTRIGVTLRAAQLGLIRL